MKKVCLVIIDGFGISETPDEANATQTAVFLRKLAKQGQYQEIFAHGKHVGLLECMAGNSEVGHMAIGAGRIIYQSILLINEAYRSGQLKEVLSRLPNLSKRIHLIGLASDAGIHGHINHLKFLMECIPSYHQVFIHAITDGIDVPPNTAKTFVAQLKNVVSVSGRYHAMDRDNNWDRTEKAFKMMTKGICNGSDTNTLYKDDVCDEYIEPILIKQENINPEDTVIMVNYRADRARQLYSMFKSYCKTYTIVEYDGTNENALLKKSEVKNTLPEWLSKNNIGQAHIAETEKYAHVTYFLNGGKDHQYRNEERVVVPSPKTTNFSSTPGTSMEGISAHCIQAMRDGIEFIVINLAGPDLVGHTGDFEMTKEAVRIMDRSVEKIFKISIDQNYAMVITADHGNSEQMTKDGAVCKSHTCNKVPLIVTNTEKSMIAKKEASLRDIAPTILTILGSSIPCEMTGTSLLE